MSQILTLYTTPVIYLAFDWVSLRLKKKIHIGNPEEHPDPAPAD